MAREFGQQQKKKKRKQQQQQENNTNIYSNTLNKIVATNRNCIAWKVQQTLARRGTGFMASHSRSRSRSRIGVCSALSQLHLAAATLMGEQETGLPRWLATRLGAGSLLLLLLHVINDDAKRLGHNPLLCAYHNQMLPAPCAPLRLLLLLPLLHLALFLCPLPLRPLRLHPQALKRKQLQQQIGQQSVALPKTNWQRVCATYVYPVGMLVLITGYFEKGILRWLG